MSENPKVGELWRQKGNHVYIGKILQVDSCGSFGGYVYIKGKWFKGGESRMCMDVFLKRYEPQPSAP